MFLIWFLLKDHRIKAIGLHRFFENKALFLFPLNNAALPFQETFKSQRHITSLNLMMLIHLYAALRLECQCKSDETPWYELRK